MDGGNFSRDTTRILEGTDTGLTVNPAERSKNSSTRISIPGETGTNVYEVIGGLPDLGYNHFPEDTEFSAIIREAEMALDAGQNPSLIQKGTSGCYFIKDREGVCRMSSASTLKNCGMLTYVYEKTER